MTSIIQLSEIRKKYSDGTLALDGISLQIEAGEVYCLFGPNGAGKTTAIRILLGLVEPTSGEVYVKGVSVREEPLLTKRHVAYLPEHLTLYRGFSARRNLEFFSRLTQNPIRSRDECYRLLSAVGLDDSAFETKVEHLSKGMRQKIGLAIALAKNTTAIILDEPTSGLDPLATRELLRLIKDVQRQGRAVLISTHDLFRAGEIASRVGIINGGRLIFEGRGQDVLEQDMQTLYFRELQTLEEEAER